MVSNNHVVEGATDLAIVYAQGGRAPATLVGTAPEFDLAVLKVDGPVPAFVTWGDSGELPLGAGVIAIGSALGQYQNTVTAGILSGFNRHAGGEGIFRQGEGRSPCVSGAVGNYHVKSSALAIDSGEVAGGVAKNRVPQN